MNIIVNNINLELEKTTEELADIDLNHELAKVVAYKFARKVVLFGLTMCTAQTFGYAYLIYIMYSWDEIEPVTYLTGAFYSCVGMGFYLKYRNDFEWGNAKEIFF
jgi:hypothetical protein